MLRKTIQQTQQPKPLNRLLETTRDNRYKDTTDQNKSSLWTLGHPAFQLKPLKFGYPAENTCSSFTTSSCFSKHSTIPL